MPRQLVAVAPREAALQSYADEPLQPGQVRVQVEYASPKHGSEVLAFRGESPHQNEYYDDEWELFLPRQHDSGVAFGRWNLGNQWIGRVSEVGPGVEGVSVGDRLCGYGGIRDTQVVTIGQDRRLRRVAPEMKWKNALCFDPAQFALGAVRDSGLRLGDAAMVVGLGAIGQLAVQMCKLAGASFVIAVDPIAIRRQVALRHGADVAMDPGAVDVGYEAKRLTGRRGVDVVVETSASMPALQMALRALAYGGTIAYAGWARPFPAGLDLGREAHFNAAQVLFSRACSEPNRDHPRWSWARIQDECWRMLESDLLDCEDIIWPVVPFDEAAEAYMQCVDRHPERSIKLGVSLRRD